MVVCGLSSKQEWVAKKHRKHKKKKAWSWRSSEDSLLGGEGRGEGERFLQSHFQGGTFSQRQLWQYVPRIKFVLQSLHQADRTRVLRARRRAAIINHAVA